MKPQCFLVYFIKKHQNNLKLALILAIKYRNVAMRKYLFVMRFGF